MPTAIVSWNAGAFLASLAAKLERGMNVAMAAVAADVVTSISVPGAGRPSPPGEPPAMQSGSLASNIGFNVERGAAEVRGAFGVAIDIPYALRLELGFAGIDSLGRHYNQQPRPFLRPALLRNRETIMSAIADQIGR